MKPEFLNVDLEVVSKVDPSPLAAALGDKVCILYCGERHWDYLVAFEVTFVRASLERRLRAFCDLIEVLPPDAMRVWKKARQRNFDIGIQSGGQRPALALRISPATLGRITALGATIAVTVYPIDS